MVRTIERGTRNPFPTEIRQGKKEMIITFARKPNAKIGNVLSLFDGISCGQVALTRAGVEYDTYYASEIEIPAITVAKKNFPKTVHLGDVTKIKGKDLPKIDLLIGGSPCQGFSVAGRELGFDDERSKLFFELVRLIRETKPKYFFLENVGMKQEWLDIISEYMGLEPVFINSRMFSAQDRKRYYWTNIPNWDWIVKDKGITFQDIAEEKGFCGSMRGRRVRDGVRVDNDTSVPLVQHIECRLDEKSNCLTTVSKDNVLVRENHRVFRSSITDVDWRYLTALECERLQTLPDNYTEGISKSARRVALGNGWTVDVIAHFFKGLQ